MRDNPIEADVKAYMQALGEADKGMGEYARDMKPAFSVELTDEEQALIWDNPSAAFPGTPMLNEQAQALLAEIKGPEWCVEWADRMWNVKRREMGI